MLEQLKYKAPNTSKGEGEEKKLTKSTCCSKSATQELASHL
jgi:hypothetical protein